MPTTMLCWHPRGRADDVKDLLFLTHRIPYPPNKGDKIRSYNLLRHLAKDYRVHLGTFIDDPQDWKHVDQVDRFCGQTCYVGLKPLKARLFSTRGFFTGEALTLPYYRNARMRRWVASVMKEHAPQRVLVFSSAMCQYAMFDGARHAHRVVDFVDIDSDKWRQYSESLNWPMSWLYRRESRTLLNFERDVARRFDASIFVSQAESELFKRLAPESAGRVSHVENGVDTDYFCRHHDLPNPYADNERVLVFTGAMDYWANADAVAWFAQTVFPEIRERVPEARFYIVGARPGEVVTKLGEQPDVHVTGSVKDIRPYLAYARAAVAPLRIARGVQNKVLEAMAMERPVLASSAALDGIVSCPALEALRADEPGQMADKAVELLTTGIGESLGKAGRSCVTAHYDWTRNLSRIEELLEHSGGARDGMVVDG